MGEKVHRLAQEAREYRGLILPVGMTPRCLDEMAGLISDFEWERFDGLASDLAVKLFEVMESHRAASQDQQAR
jgi:hypothetical protein